MKLNLTQIEENYLSSEVIDFALAYFLNPSYPSLKYATHFFLIDTPQNVLQ
jgi:hypothetical protein